jgi:hypothetical protein
MAQSSIQTCRQEYPYSRYRASQHAAYVRPGHDEEPRSSASTKSFEIDSILLRLPYHASEPRGARHACRGGAILKRLIGHSTYTLSTLRDCTAAGYQKDPLLANEFDRGVRLFTFKARVLHAPTKTRHAWPVSPRPDHARLLLSRKLAS